MCKRKRWERLDIEKAAVGDLDKEDTLGTHLAVLRYVPWRKGSAQPDSDGSSFGAVLMSFLVCKHRHSGVAETANPGSGNRESGNAETAIAVMSYGCRI